MIDRPALIAWRSKAPWPNPVQIEQDLLLSRLMIEIARDGVLGPAHSRRPERRVEAVRKIKAVAGAYTRQAVARPPRCRAA